MFSLLVSYLRSNASPVPLKSVPLLIKMIRLAEEERVTLPLDLIDGLCSSILTRAVNKSSDKSAKLSDALAGLVDLVVEVQAAQVASELNASALRCEELNKKKSEATKVASASAEVALTHSREGDEEKSEDIYFSENISVWLNVLFAHAEELSSSIFIFSEVLGEQYFTINELSDAWSTNKMDPSLPDLCAMASFDSFHVQIIEEILRAYLRRPKTSITRAITSSLQVSPSLSLSLVPNLPWWDRSHIKLDELESQSLIKSTSLKKIFLKDTVLRRLKQAIHFLSALLGAGNIMGNGSLFRYPTAMLSKIWYDSLSLCALEESAHPYKTTRYTKHVAFPGADKLKVTLDRRCMLGAGAVLTLSGAASKPVKIDATTTSSDAALDALNKSLTIEGSELFINFEVSPVTKADGELVEASNDLLDWGWALLICAVGSVYESASVSIEVPAILPKSSNVTPLVAKFQTNKVDSLDKLNPESPKKESSSSGALESDKDANSKSKLVLASESKVIAKDKESSAIKREQRETDEAVEQSICNMVATKGSFISDGDLCVPHATSVEVSVARPNQVLPSADASSIFSAPAIIYVMTVVYMDETEEQHKLQFRILGGELSLKFSLNTNRLHYTVTAMSDLAAKTELLAGPLLSKKEEGDESKSDIKELTTLVAASAGGESESSACASGVAAFESLESHEQLNLSAVFEPPTNWQCEICTLFNSLDVSSCEVCSTPRPSMEVGGERGGGGGGGVSNVAPVVQTGWWCTVCTFINPLSSSGSVNFIYFKSSIYILCLI